MGKFDTLTKKYMSSPDIFADAFNYLIYNGRQVIKPSALRDADATEVIVAYGANEKEKLPVQKTRDNLQVWAVKCDDEAKYVLLGSENQSKVHFAMPVRNMLYDSINYAAQVDAAHKSYKCLNASEDGIKIELTSEEFLSGFRKDDKLIPVITAVVLFNNDEWDAPTSIHEMIDAPKELLPFIADYKLNLISPQIISDEDFTTQEHQGKFSTGFGTLMQVIKHQNEMNVVDIIKSAPDVDSDSADMIEEFSNFKFDRDPEKKGVIDMCKGMELYTLKTQVEASIKSFRSMNLDDEEIVKRVAELFNVTTDYVKKLMIPETV